jgi:hypothetical protein
MRSPGRALHDITPTGTLDQNIIALIKLFPTGLENAGSARWDAIKQKYAAGLTDPNRMATAKSMLFNLSTWVRDHSGSMATPPSGETKPAAAARLIEYMALYVFGGPTTPVPGYAPGADNTVGFVTPDAAATIVTPSTRAGVHLDAGSVDENTIVVITENPTPYPAACSGPLQTRLCQYPRFYTFDQFPHKRLLKAATFAVCHVNAGSVREPLADHDRFRLAHAKPDDPADYTPGSTIRDQNGESVEVLPLVHQAFTTCEDVEYTADAGTGINSLLRRAMGAVGRVLTPKLAYAIDQGGGGLSFAFSPFNDVDPLGTPDLAVQSLVAPETSIIPGDKVAFSYSIINTGTATATPFNATFRLSSTEEGTTTGTVIGTLPVAALVPGAVASTNDAEITLPLNLQPGDYYIGMTVNADPTFPDPNGANNSSVVPIHIDACHVYSLPSGDVSGEIRANDCAVQIELESTGHAVFYDGLTLANGAAMLFQPSNMAPPLGSGVISSTEDPREGFIFGAAIAPQSYRVIGNGDPLRLLVVGDTPDAVGPYTISRTQSAEAFVCGTPTILLPGAAAAGRIDATTSCQAKLQYPTDSPGYGQPILADRFTMRLFQDVNPHTITLSNMDGVNPTITVFFNNQVVAQSVAGAGTADGPRSLTFSPQAPGNYVVEISSGGFVRDQWTVPTGTYTLTVTDAVIIQ